MVLADAEISDLVGMHAGQGEHLGGAGVAIFESGIADAPCGDAEGFGDGLHEVLGSLPGTGEAHEEVIANAAGLVQRNFIHDEIFGLGLDLAAGSR